MTPVWAAIAPAPVLAWAIFAAMLLLAAWELRTTERPPAQLFVLPAVLSIFALDNLTVADAAPVLEIAAFAVSFASGIGVGWNLAPRGVAAFKDRGRVRVPGSVAPLSVALALAVLRQAAGSLYGRWPELRADPSLALELGATSALLAGIVWGRIVRVVLIYRRAA